MSDFLEDRIEVEDYIRQYFSLAVKRQTLTAAESQILQCAYGDADDFDQRVPSKAPPTPVCWVNENGLKARVAKSYAELAALWVRSDSKSSQSMGDS